MTEQKARLGNYIILERIAIGGMAEVFLAKMLATDRLVAIKKILPQRAQTPEYLASFKEEIKLSLNLHHGNIVGFLDFFEDDKQIYLVMEFVNGFSLRRLISDVRKKKQPLSLERSLHIVSEVAAGLDNAHRCLDRVTNKKLNIIHRDVNPHNIMIGFDGSVKVIDFGIAKADIRTDVTKVGVIKGKFSYMSPEQAAAMPLDARTDVYSLGVVLWELITGRRLHDNKNNMHTLQKIMTKPASSPREFLPGLPFEIERIVMRALEMDPSKRYQKVSDFKFEIDQYLQVYFPKFRASDFSEFISEFYNDIIKHRTERLIFYASHDYLDAVSSAPASPLSPSSPPPLPPTMTEVELPEGFAGADAAKENINFENINFEELKKENPLPYGAKSFSKQRAAQFYASSSDSVNSWSAESKENINLKIFQFVERSSLWQMKGLVSFLVLLYGGYYFFYLSDKNLTKENTGQNNAAITTSGETAIAARLPAKDADFSSQVYQKLRKTEQLAYLNITLSKSQSADTNIFINGKAVYEKAPIQMYPVYANRVITVTAFNPKKNTYDERKITILPGKKADLNLSLRPYRPKKK